MFVVDLENLLRFMVNALLDRGYREVSRIDENVYKRPGLFISFPITARKPEECIKKDKYIISLVYTGNTSTWYNITRDWQGILKEWDIYKNSTNNEVFWHSEGIMFLNDLYKEITSVNNNVVIDPISFSSHCSSVEAVTVTYRDERTKYKLLNVERSI